VEWNPLSRQVNKLRAEDKIRSRATRSDEKFPADKILYQEGLAASQKATESFGEDPRSIFCQEKAQGRGGAQVRSSSTAAGVHLKQWRGEAISAVDGSFRHQSRHDFRISDGLTPHEAESPGEVAAGEKVGFVTARSARGSTVALTNQTPSGPNRGARGGMSQEKVGKDEGRYGKVVIPNVASSTHNEVRGAREKGPSRADRG
jgi:hypothetical protein